MGRRRKKQFSGLTEKAIFEGVLMKNQNKYSLEVRKTDGEVQTVVKNAEANPDKLIKKIPFVRGIFVLVQNIILVLEALEFSADFFGNDTDKETFADKILVKLFGKHTNMIVTAVTAMVSFVIGVGFLTIVPVLLARFMENYIVNQSVINIIEFAAYVLIMVVFILSMLLFKDVRRMMKYHAAAHKCINCVERGRKLNYKNVASSSKFFGRCSTGYILSCVIFTAALFVFVKIDSVPLRLLFRVIYLPIATGLFYEFYVLINHLPDGIFYKIFTVPTIIVQSVLLIRPDDEMITTAIAGMDAVFDWKEFLVYNFPGKYASSDFGLDKKKESRDKEHEDLVLTEEQMEREFEELNKTILEEAISSEETEEYAEYDGFSDKKSGRYINEEGYEEGYVNYSSNDDSDGDYYSDESTEYYEEESYSEGVEFYDEEGYPVNQPEEAYEVYYEASEDEELAENQEYVEDEELEDDILDIIASDETDADMIDEAEEDIEATVNEEIDSAYIEETEEELHAEAEDEEADLIETAGNEDSVETDEDVKDVSKETEDSGKAELSDGDSNSKDGSQSEASDGGSDASKDDSADQASEDEAFDDADDSVELIDLNEEDDDSTELTDINEETDDSVELTDMDEQIEEADVKSESEDINVVKEVDKLTKTQPISIDFTDDYGFDPEDEEVPENEMVFEPVDESTVDLAKSYAQADEEEGNVPLFSKEIESIPMPDSLDNIVEYLPEGGVMSRIYNLNTDEADRNEFYEEEEEDFDNIIDENGHLTLKDTEAFNRKLDEEYDEIFKRLGLDTDDL